MSERRRGLARPLVGERRRARAEPALEAEPRARARAGARAGSDAEPEAVEELEPAAGGEHAAGELEIPDDVDVLEGEAGPTRRSVAIVVSKFNGEITTKLLESALAELDRLGVAAAALDVVPVPGAFELPLAAMALAKTRRYTCVVALGCVIRGETPHFDFVASEAASGLQLAALETGVPVSFGVLTCENAEQAEARVDKGAEAVRTALEMADLFAQLRRAAAASRSRASATLAAADVEDLRNLRQEARVRQQPEPLDGGHEAPLQPEPPARARPDQRQGDARLRLHALPKKSGRVEKASHRPIALTRSAAAYVCRSWTCSSTGCRASMRARELAPRRAARARAQPPPHRRPERLPGSRRRHGDEHDADRARRRRAARSDDSDATARRSRTS